MAGESPGHTLQPTALVNEAYLRLVDVQKCKLAKSCPLLRVSAQLMRRILVDFARSRRSLNAAAMSSRSHLEEGTIVSRDRGADGRRTRRCPQNSR